MLQAWRGARDQQDADDVDADLKLTHDRFAAATSVAVIGGGAAAVSSAANIALRLRLALERAEEIYLETSMCAERRGDTNLIELRRDAPDVWEQ